MLFFAFMYRSHIATAHMWKVSDVLQLKSRSFELSKAVSGMFIAPLVLLKIYCKLSGIVVTNVMS